MAIDNAAYVKNMDVAIPANTDPRSEGAGQMRAIKEVLKNTFPNLDGAVNAAPAEFNKILDGTMGRFKGEVTMFSGQVADIPKGWHLCDGSLVNGYTVPNLKGKFIMGYDPDDIANNPMRNEGGTNTDTFAKYLNSEEYALTVAQIPPHKHPLPYNETGSGGGGSGPDVLGGSGAETQETGGGLPHKHDLTDNKDHAFDNRPEYVVLAFICYVGA